MLGCDQCVPFCNICVQGGVACPLSLSLSLSLSLTLSLLEWEEANNRRLGGAILACDGLHLPYRTNSLDHVLSIAVIHHLASEERRIQGMCELLRVLRPGGTMLVTVWAIRQDKKTYETDGGDVMIPWHLTPRFHNNEAVLDHGHVRVSGDNTEVVYQRFYHLFDEGELLRLAVTAVAR